MKSSKKTRASRTVILITQMLALLLAVVTAGDPEVGSEITYTTTMVPLAAPTAVHW